MRIFLFLLLCISCQLWSQVNKNGDFQVWSYGLMEIELQEQWELQISTEFRWGDGASVLFFKYVQGQIFYQPLSWLQLGPGYRQTYSRTIRTDQQWSTVYNPLMDVTLFFPVPSWLLINRNRIQYLMQENASNQWLYRNRLLAVFPWSANFLQITPFISDEVFIRQRKGFSENRLSTGFTATLARFATLRPYYTWRYLKMANKNWNYQNVLAIQLYLWF